MMPTSYKPPTHNRRNIYSRDSPEGFGNSLAHEEETQPKAQWALRIKHFFTEELSVVGVKYVFSSSVFILRRLIWIFLVLIGLGFMFFQIRDRIIFYMSKPTRVDVTITNENVKSFPTITICNENIIDKTRSKYKYLLPNGLQELMKTIYPAWPQISTKPNFTVMKNLSAELEFRNKTWEYFWEILSPFENKRHIEMCVFDGEPCDKNNFTLVATTMGYCLQFNGEGFDYKCHRPGLISGLSLVLNARQHEFLFTKSTASGFRVLVGNKDNFLHVHKYGFHVSTGFVNVASVRSRSVTLLPVPYGKEDCTSDPQYIYNECLETCRQEKVIETCGCKYFFYKGSNTTSCNPQQMYECADKELSEYPLNNKTASLCGCKPQCTTETFTYSLSQAVMSDFAVNAAAISHMETSCPNIKDCSSQGDLHNFEQEIKRDWAQIEIYFSDLLHERVITKPAYPLLQLLCDIGGAMGLILGSTVLSFFEIIDFILVMSFDWSLWNIRARNVNV